MNMVDEITLLIALGTLNLLALGGLSMWIRRELEDSMEQLDNSLALALKNTIENLTGEGVMAFEPPNPITTAIGQLLMASAQKQMNTVEATVTTRGTDGQFIEKP